MVVVVVGMGLELGQRERRGRTRVCGMFLHGGCGGWRLRSRRRRLGVASVSRDQALKGFLESVDFTKPRVDSGAEDEIVTTEDTGCHCGGGKGTGRGDAPEVECL